MGKVLDLFKADYYVVAYESALMGQTDKGIARQIGVSVGILKRWLILKPAFKEAIDKGRRKHRSDGGLTKKQEAFIREYIIDLNPRRAALAAGYKKELLHTYPYVLMKKPHIRRAIQAEMDRRAKSLEVDARWVLERLIKIADANLQDAYDDEGNHKSVPQLPRDLAYALRKVRTTPRMKKDGLTEEVLEISVADQRAALELIGKHLGMFEEQVNVKHHGAVLLDILDSIEGKGQTIVDEELIEEEAKKK
jgi:phage terminase small subunit